MMNFSNLEISTFHQDQIVNQEKNKLEKKNTKDEFGGFGNYEGINILDKIMGGGVGSRRGGGGISGMGGNKDYGSTFITGQLKNDKKTDFHFDEFDNKPKINDKKEKEFDDVFHDSDFKTKKIEDEYQSNKKENEVKKEESKNEKEEEFEDNFDDFDIEDL